MAKKSVRIAIPDDILQDFLELVKSGNRPNQILKAGVYSLKNKDKLPQQQTSIPPDIINAINQLSNKLTELENKLNDLSTKLSNIKPPENIQDIINKLENLYNKLSNMNQTDNLQNIMNKIAELENKIQYQIKLIKNLQDQSYIKSETTSQSSYKTYSQPTYNQSNSTQTHTTYQSQQSSNNQQKSQKPTSAPTIPDPKKIYQEAYAMAMKEIEKEKQPK